MKKLIPFLIFLMLLSGCGKTEAPPDIAATTLPVFEFTQALCQDTPLRVERLITESVSCLHDYALKVDQVKTAEAAQTLVISGAGLEEFMEDILDDSKTIDASRGIDLLGDGEEDHADHQEEDSHHHEDGHHHESDPHIWLSPENAKRMAAAAAAVSTAERTMRQRILFCFPVISIPLTSRSRSRFQPFCNSF